VGLIFTHNLCGNCGAITKDEDWELLQPLEEGGYRPHNPDDSDAYMRCPICQYTHNDDDADPGVWDGTEGSLWVQRDELVEDNYNYAGNWVDVLTQLVLEQRVIADGYRPIH